jgi:hypothetical protein
MARQMYSWLLKATSNAPVVTKTYDVDVPVGQPAHKKIAHVNPWDKPRFYKVHSSDETVLKPRYDRIEVPAQEKAYIRVRGRGSQHRYTTSDDPLIRLTDPR